MKARIDPRKAVPEATKAATISYVKSLTKQLASKGIRVNGVAPGPVWTPLQISGCTPEQKYE